MTDPTLRRRAGVAAVLGILAIAFVIITSQTDSPHNGTSVSRPLIGAVDSLVDTFLRDQGIDRKKERKWSVRNPQGRVIRMERRIQVPRELITLELNRALSEAVAAIGGHVAGSERTKESTVVLHVVVDEMTLHTLTLEPLTPSSR